MKAATPKTEMVSSLSPRQEWWRALLVALCAAVAVITPFFWLGIASGHDFDFHAASWLDVAGQWREGIIYPRWTEWANHGFGEPRFIFYPPFSWLLGAGLGTVLPWISVPAIFTIMTQTLGGLAAFALSRSVLPLRVALFCAACYAANPYSLLIVYVRSDFAEQLALAFFPLLIFYALRLAGVIASRHSRTYSTVLFSVFFAAIWLSNAPAGVMATYATAALFFWLAIAGRRLSTLLFGGVGIVVGFALCAFYLVPAAYEQRWVSIARVLTSGLRPDENFLYTVTNDPEHTLFNWIASTVCILMLLVAFVSALLAHRRGGDTIEPSNSFQRVWSVMLALCGLVTFATLKVSAPLWILLPKLQFLQFPWRWMFVLALPFAFLTGAAVGKRKAFWVWGATVMALIFGCASILIQETWWDSDDLPSIQEAIRKGQGFEGTDEYDPLGDDNSNLPEESPQVEILNVVDGLPNHALATVAVEVWNAEHKQMRVTASRPSRLAVRLLNYPAWKISVNGRPVLAQTPENYSQILVPLPAGDSQVDIRFARTKDRAIGGVLSAVTLLGIILIMTLGKSRKVKSPLTGEPLALPS